MYCCDSLTECDKYQLSLSVSEFKSCCDSLTECDKYQQAPAQDLDIFVVIPLRNVISTNEARR